MNNLKVRRFEEALLYVINAEEHKDVPWEVKRIFISGLLPGIESLANNACKEEYDNSNEEPIVEDK